MSHLRMPEMDLDRLDSSNLARRFSKPRHLPSGARSAVLIRWVAVISLATRMVAFAETPASALAKRVASAAKPGSTEFSINWSAPERVVVPMKMRQGLPTISCSVNGHAVWCIVDTGSQECVLEARTARECDVRLLASAQGRVEVTGACGNESARVGVPESVSIGGWQWKGFPFVVRTADPAKSISKSSIAFNILGISALQTMCSYVTLDYARREVVFGFKQTYRPSSGAGRSSFAMRHGVPFVKVSHAGQDWEALLDTGASSKLEIGEATAARLASKGTARWFRGSRIGLGASSEARERRFQSLRLGQVTCLGQTWNNIEAILVDGETKIGSGLCQSQRLTLDFAASQIWLESPAPPRE